MITSFKLFESNLEIEKICKNLGIEDFQIVDELVNVLKNVDISDKELTRIPVKFGRVEGNFYCYNNQLTHLEGGPQSVGGDFDCRNNQLIHLEGCPEIVGGDFYCRNNQLTSLEGAPRSVGRNFYCYNNQLTTLEGSPQSVGGYFYCYNNQLTTFRGIPEYSLNEEKSFYCNENPIHEIYKLFNTPKCIDLINEYEVIGDGQISRVKLEEVFLELGLEVPKKFNFQHYKLIG
jgi:hypothetical protein